jgi:RimJ/RimL family protein N-acetyltransferase
MNAHIEFFPPNSDAPAILTAPDFILRPLQASHVELDYDAVMEDPAYLRAWGQTGWPADDFTLDENLQDLIHHEREHREGEAFTFTVLSIEGTRCLGCVYITPIGMRIPVGVIPRARLSRADAFIADICFWIRPSMQREDLDQAILRSLHPWLLEDWPFDQIFIHTSEDDQRQQEIFATAGLEPVTRFQSDQPRPGRWVLYEITP